MTGPGTRLLFSEADIQQRVHALGAALTATYSGADELVAVGILKGSTPFLADLVRAVKLDVAVDFMAISSYAEDRSRAGTVRIVKDLEGDIGGKDVLVVEDIVDTGLTLSYLARALRARDPRSLRSVALLDRLARRIVPVAVDFVGFAIPDVFVLGYGLDWQGRYRNLRDLLAVDEPGALPSGDLAENRRAAETLLGGGVRFGP